MPSFDVKCGFDMQEMDNAVNMVKRDILNRYDFKGSSSSITLNKNDNNIIIKGDIDYQVNAVFDMLQNRSVTRKVSLKTFKPQEIEKASGMTLRQTILLQSGISKEQGKSINTLIKKYNG